MATNIGGVEIEIRGDDTHFERTLREVRREAGRTGQTLTREFRQADVAAKTLNNSIRTTGVSIAAMAATLGAGVGLSAGIRTLADFSQGMSTIKAVTQATDVQFVLLEQKAKLLGATTRFSATQVADGMTFLARAGFTVDEVLSSIEVSLNLATSGALDLGRAADILSNIMTAFGIEAAESARVADVLALAANSSNTSIDQLGTAMAYAAPAAAQLGLSIEDTAAAIQVLSDAGIQGESAGSSVRNILGRLASPSPGFVKTLKEMGLTLDDVNIRTNGLSGAMANLIDAGLGAEEAFELFELRGGNAVAVLAQGADKMNDYADANRNAGGTLSRVAEIMDDNLNGAILGTVSAMEALIIELGKVGAESALTTGFKGLADLLRLAARNADILSVTLVALSARAILPLAANLIKGSAALGVFSTALQLLTVQGGAALVAKQALMAIGGPLTLVIAGLAAAYVVYARSTISASEALNKVTDSLSKFQKAQDDIATDTKLLTDAQGRLTDAIESQGDAAVATATLEIDAIQRRISKNEQLAQTYKSLAQAQLAQARAATAQTESSLARDLNVSFTGGLGASASGDALQQQIDQFVEMTSKVQAAGGQLSAWDRAVLEQITTLRTYELQVAAAEEAISALGQAVTAPTEEVAPSADRSPAAEQLTDAEKEAAARRAEQRRVAEAQYAIDQARVLGNETLARHLEEQLEISQRLSDLMEFMTDEQAAFDMAIASVVGKRQQETAELQRQADLKRQQMLDSAAAAQEDAEATRALTLAQARGNEDEIRALEQILDFRQRVAYYQSQNMSAADAVAQAELDIDAQNVLRDAQFQQTIADQVAAGLEQGILTGDWGSVFKGILAKSTSEALSEAINELASVLVDVIGGALKGSNFGGGIGSAIASIFGGGRAAGGSVLPGMRYLVGEQGPEMFVPSVPGSIVPKFEGPASVAQGGVPGIQSLSISAPFIVQGSITEEVLPRVQAMMAAQARELPRVIDARVSDSIRRNRY